MHFHTEQTKKVNFQSYDKAGNKWRISISGFLDFVHCLIFQTGYSVLETVSIFISHEKMGCTYSVVSVRKTSVYRYWSCNYSIYLYDYFFSYGIAGMQNVQGEEVKKLDVLANELFINMLSSSYTTCMLISEENETVIEVRIEICH